MRLRVAADTSSRKAVPSVKRRPRPRHVAAGQRRRGPGKLHPGPRRQAPQRAVHRSLVDAAAPYVSPSGSQDSGSWSAPDASSASIWIRTGSMGCRSQGRPRTVLATDQCEGVHTGQIPSTFACVLADALVLTTMLQLVCRRSSTPAGAKSVGAAQAEPVAHLAAVHTGDRANTASWVRNWWHTAPRVPVGTMRHSSTARSTYWAFSSELIPVTLHAPVRRAGVDPSGGSADSRLTGAVTPLWRHPGAANLPTLRLRTGGVRSARDHVRASPTTHAPRSRPQPCQERPPPAARSGDVRAPGSGSWSRSASGV